MKTTNKVIRYIALRLLVAIGVLFGALLLLLIYLAINYMYFLRENKNIKAHLTAMNISLVNSDTSNFIIAYDSSYKFHLGEYKVNLYLAKNPIFAKYQELPLMLDDCKRRLAPEFRIMEPISDVKLGGKNCAYKVGNDDPGPRIIKIYFGRGNTTIECNMQAQTGVDITTTKEYGEMLRLLTLIDNSLK